MKCRSFIFFRAQVGAGNVLSSTVQAPETSLDSNERLSNTITLYFMGLESIGTVVCLECHHFTDVCIRLFISHYITHWLLRVALLTFETAAPTTLLVACVVRYAIWPRVLQAGGNTTQLKGFQAIVMHNVNVMLALVEVSLLGGIPVRFSHFPVAPMFGIVYILFTWFMIPRWIPGKPSAQFIYFFFDTTLGIKFMVIALLSLLMILMTFYGLFGAFDQVLTHLQGGPIVHTLAVILLSSVVCRFRD